MWRLNIRLCINALLGFDPPKVSFFGSKYDGNFVEPYPLHWYRKVLLFVNLYGTLSKNQAFQTRQHKTTIIDYRGFSF